MRSTRFALAALAFSIMAAGVVPANAQQDEMRARGDKACNGDAKRVRRRAKGRLTCRNSANAANRPRSDRISCTH